MNTTLYEVSDMRKIAPEAKLAPIALIENRPDALHVLEVTGQSHTLALGEEAGEDNWEWANGDLTVYLPEGMVHFTPLREDSDAIAFTASPLDQLVQYCLS